MRRSPHPPPSPAGRPDIFGPLVIFAQVIAFAILVVALHRFIALPVWEACVIAAPLFFIALSGVIWLLLGKDLNRPAYLPQFLGRRNRREGTAASKNPAPVPLVDEAHATSSILHFQRKLLSPKSSVAEVLRVAEAIAIGLNAGDVTRWIQLELNGYGGDPVPNYRMLKGGSLQVLKPPLGWHFVGHDDLIVPLSQSIHELEGLLRQASIVVPAQIPPPVAGGSVAPDCPRQMVLPSASINNVIQTVKALVLDWTIELGRRGITGHDLIFDENEKQSAKRERFDLQDKIAPFLAAETLASPPPPSPVLFPRHLRPVSLTAHFLHPVAGWSCASAKKLDNCQWLRKHRPDESKPYKAVIPASNLIG